MWRQIFWRTTALTAFIALTPNLIQVSAMATYNTTLQYTYTRMSVSQTAHFTQLKRLFSFLLGKTGRWILCFNGIYFCEITKLR